MKTLPTHKKPFDIYYPAEDGNPPIFIKCIYVDVFFNFGEEFLTELSSNQVEKIQMEYRKTLLQSQMPDLIARHEELNKLLQTNFFDPDKIELRREKLLIFNKIKSLNYPYLAGLADRMTNARYDSLKNQLTPLPSNMRMEVKKARLGGYLVKLGGKYIDFTTDVFGGWIGLSTRKNALWFTGKQAHEYCFGKKGYQIVKR